MSRDWETGLNEWVANNAKFSPPLCYQYTLTIHTMGAPTTTRLVQVKNGVALGGDMSLTGYMDEIRSSCYDLCPASGAACDIVYFAAGYPSQILIDDDQKVVGEEINVGITNFAEVQCDEIVELPAPVEVPVDVPVDAPVDASDSPSLTPLASDPPSDFKSDPPSDVPSLRMPVDAPFGVVAPATAPITDIAPAAPQADDSPTSVSDIEGGSGGSSAAALSLLPMAALTVLLQAFP